MLVALVVVLALVLVLVLVLLRVSLVLRLTYHRWGRSRLCAAENG